jgi:hypothetical protein
MTLPMILPSGVSWAKAIPTVKKQMMSKRNNSLFFIRFDSALLMLLTPLPWGEPATDSPQPLALKAGMFYRHSPSSKISRANNKSFLFLRRSEFSPTNNSSHRSTMPEVYGRPHGGVNSHEEQ